MKRLNKAALALMAAGVLSSGVAKAALFDRGGGLIYDDVLNITWLSDANYAATQFAATGGVQGDADGLMTWRAANVWADSLSISRFAGETLSGWRLAANAPVVGTDWNYNFSYDGTTDVGYNITSSHNEMSYMYYINLGLKGAYSPAGADQPNWGVFGNGTAGGQNNVSPVKNLQSYVYWSGTAYEPFPADVAWGFVTEVGSQGFLGHNFELYAWAVRPGDVAAVPEPEVYAQLMAGLGLLGVVAKRRRWALATS